MVKYQCSQATRTGATVPNTVPNKTCSRTLKMWYNLHYAGWNLNSLPGMDARIPRMTNRHLPGCAMFFHPR